MARIKHWMQRGFWLDGLWITVLSVLMTLVLYLTGLSLPVFDPLGDALDGFHMSDGFFYAHNSDRNPVPNEGIVIVDIAECDSREGIASIVERINAGCPRVLAVDIIFGPSATLDHGTDSLLVNAFKSCPGTLVFAKNGDLHSFFSEELICLEGDVAMESGPIRTFSLKESFVGAIARAVGLVLPASDKDILIDYTRAETPVYTPDQVIRKDGIEGNIVILGDNSDLRDRHSVPSDIHGSNTVPGTLVYAQELYTLLSGRKFRELPKALNLILSIILVWLFASLVAAPLKGHECKFDNLQMSVQQFVSFVIIFGFAYFLFWRFNLNVSLVWSLIGFTIVGLATEVYVWMKSWNIWKLIRNNT